MFFRTSSLVSAQGWIVKSRLWSGQIQTASRDLHAFRFVKRRKNIFAGFRTKCLGSAMRPRIEFWVPLDTLGPLDTQKSSGTLIRSVLNEHTEFTNPGLTRVSPRSDARSSIAQATISRMSGEYPKSRTSHAGPECYQCG
jgi:hypothetical protein